MLRDTVHEWREKAESYRQIAAFYRNLIEQAECPGGRGSYPRWAETKAILLETAECFECYAEAADARAAEAS